jgi:pimeloyl-ACP methyl ester carboxylesterase
VFIRGFLDWYSTGVDQLANDLRSDGFAVQTFREEQWRDVAAALRQRFPSRHRLVLIGFSYGADDAILISRRLADVHQPVDLLITLDPVTPAKIPANVKRCINFYEPNGFWDLFPWLRGVSVAADPGVVVQNINIRIRPDLNEPGTSHATIAGNEKLQALILRLVWGEMRNDSEMQNAE